MTLTYDSFGTAFSAAQARDILNVLDAAQAALAINREVPPEVEKQLWEVASALPTEPGAYRDADPYLTEALLAGTLATVRALHEPEPPRRELRLAVEQARQALRDLLHDAPAAEDRPASDVARWLTDALDVGVAELAALVGVSPRTFHRWMAEPPTEPSGFDAARLRIVARIANQLRHVFTGPGVVAWFERGDLGGATPAELLNEPARYPELVAAASRYRSTVAS